MYSPPTFWEVLPVPLLFVRSRSNPIHETWTRYENGPTTNLQNCKCQQVSTSILLGQNAGKSLWNKVFWYAVIANNHEVMPRTRQIWHSRNVKNIEVMNARRNFSTHFLSHYFDIKSNSFFILSLQAMILMNISLVHCYNTCQKGNNIVKKWSEVDSAFAMYITGILLVFKILHYTTDLSVN